MNLKLKIKDNSLDLFFQPVYSKSDYALLYQIKGIENHTGGNFIIYNNIIFTFCTHCSKLLCIDGFANIDFWELKDEINIPNYKKIGWLVVENGFDETDRYSFDKILRFRYSNQGIFQIIIDEEEGSVYYKVSPDLVVGIKNKLLTVLYLNNLKID